MSLARDPPPAPMSDSGVVCLPKGSTSAVRYIYDAPFNMHAPLSFTSPATTKVSPRCYGPQVFALVSLWCEREDAISAQSESGGDAHITYAKNFDLPTPSPCSLSSIVCFYGTTP